MAVYQVETDNGTYEVETEDPISKPESFGRAAANNFPLAPQAIAGLSEGDYSQNMADWNAKAASAKEANPITYGAGAVTGAMAPLAIPGVGEVMAANPITGNAILGAASAVSNRDVLQHPEEAAKDVVKGGLIGGMTAGVLGKLGKLVPDEAALTAKAEAQAVKSAGLPPKSMDDMSGKFESMGKFINERPELIKGSLEARHGAAEGLRSQFGEKVGSLKAGAGQFANAAETAPFTDPLMAKASENAGRMDPFFKSQGNVYIHGAQDIQQNGTSIEGLQALKTAYGNRAFNSATGEVKDEAAKDVWIQVTRAMDHLVGKSAPEYQAAKAGYSQAQQVSEGLGKQLGIERTEGGHGGVGGHGLHSLIKQIPNISKPALGVPAGVALAGVGHPVLGAVLGLHSLTSSPEVRNAALNTAAKAVGPIGAAIKAGTTEGLVSRLHSNPQSFGPYAPALQNAYKDGGNQGVAATHYILSTTHPEYNQMMLDQEGDNNNANR